MVCLKNEKDTQKVRMMECAALCEACEIESVSELVQFSRSLDPKTVLRSGKLQELASLIAALHADMVVFVNNLSIAAMNRIQAETGVQVIDRTTLILDIFSKRAQSKQAKMQVELARLRYALPSLSLENESEAHFRGGQYRSRGAGESRSAEIARTYRRRIAALTKSLAEIRRENETAERRRGKSGLARCALVGYTNAGKSSLMNAMLRYENKEERSVFAKDMLFATLDSSVRNMEYQGRQFLLYDTVGFVSDLPTTLVEAFQSTLEAACSADLLVHVIDGSDPLRNEKTEAAEATLRQIHADGIPILRVYAKMDAPGFVKEDGVCSVSSLSLEGIEPLLKEITSRLYPDEKSIVVCIPYEKSGILHMYQSVVDVMILEETETGYLARITGQKTRLKPFLLYEVKK